MRSRCSTAGGIAQRAILVAPAALSSLTPGQITTIAGGSTFLDDGLPAASATVFAGGVAVDAEGNVFIADTANNRIRKVNAKSGIITTVAGSGEQSFAGDDRPATAASLNGFRPHLPNPSHPRADSVN
ncbi:MAG: hypothetical protein HY654_03640 [Acidobacteria bacterium]|nr:hypothetical protein [Acidobacteriota bacterium]